MRSAVSCKYCSNSSYFKPATRMRLAVLKTTLVNRGMHLTVANQKLNLRDNPERLVYPVGWAGITTVSVLVAEPAGAPPSAQQPTAVRISRVWPDSPAALAGLRVDDVIEAVN